MSQDHKRIKMAPTGPGQGVPAGATGISVPEFPESKEDLTAEQLKQHIKTLYDHTKELITEVARQNVSNTELRNHIQNLTMTGQNNTGFNRMADFPTTAVYSTAHKSCRTEVEFRKVAPKFYLSNDTFSLFVESFKSASMVYPVSEIAYKNILFNSLMGEARAIASDYCPSKTPYKEMNVDEYIEELSELYEPKSESSMKLIAYQARKQMAGEHVQNYYRVKLAMFFQAYKKEQRHYEGFYESVVQGLICLQLRADMRKFHPEPLDNTSQYAAKLLDYTAALQRAYLNNELSEHEIKGCEPRPAMLSFRTGGYANNIPQIKGESGIHAIHAIRSNKEPTTLTCWKCGVVGHLKRDCRKDGVNECFVEEHGPNCSYTDPDLTFDDQEITDQELDALANFVSKRRFKGRGKNQKPRTHYQQPRRFVATVCSNEQGQLYLESEGSASSSSGPKQVSIQNPITSQTPAAASTPAAPAPAAPVNTIRDEEYDSYDDVLENLFINDPNDFLGKRR